MAAVLPNAATLFDLDASTTPGSARRLPDRRTPCVRRPVIAQTLIAASRYRRGRLPHSLHAYFILGGEIEQPITYDVERLRDGNSFSTRRVTAQQNGQVIYSTIVSFQATEDGFLPSDADAGRRAARNTGRPPNRSRPNSATNCPRR